MSNEIVIPAGFGPLSTLAAGGARANQDELGAGIRTGFAVMGYRGKVWATKHQGTETPLMREDGDGARGSIEVVIVKAASPIAKIYYAGGYVEGSSAAPDCWSTNGLTPDAGATNRQAPACAACPKNAWGSRITESGKQGKACSDSKRLAIVPLGDIDNEVMGGPMLLRVPADSLKDVQAYGQKLGAAGYPYYAVGTRISFDPTAAHPKFVLSPLRPLNDAEMAKINALRDDPRIAHILNESAEHGAPAPVAAPAIQFEMATPEVTADKPAPVAEPKPEPKKAEPKKKSAAQLKAEAAAAAAAAALAAAEAEAEAEEEEADSETGEIPMAATPADFDAMLDSLLPK
jgi:hypothetical protein